MPGSRRQDRVGSVVRWLCCPISPSSRSSSVRSTVQKPELLAEPFLLAGIIASITEIAVLSVESAKVVGKGWEFDHRIVEISVLGVLVLLLEVTSFMLRRKEREPDEGKGSRPAPERQVD